MVIRSQPRGKIGVWGEMRRARLREGGSGERIGEENMWGKGGKYRWEDMMNGVWSKWLGIGGGVRAVYIY